MRGFRVPGSASIMFSGLSADSNFASAKNSHPTDDAPRPDTGQTWGEIVHRRIFYNLCRRRIGQNKICYVAKIEISCNRQNPHSDQLACLGTDNRDTHYFTICRLDYFYMTAWSALCLRAVIIVIGPSRYPNLCALLKRPRLGEPNLRKLRVGKSDPRDTIIVNTRRQAE